MEKSETVSNVRPSEARICGQPPKSDMLPFSGLGFDLDAVLTAPIEVTAVRRARRETVRPHVDTPFPSGRRLQIGLGREIRGR